MNNTNLWIIKQISERLKELKMSKEYFTSPKDFSRDRVFTFETVFFLIANLPRLSLSVEIEQGLARINELLGKELEGTKSGFCKARKKIKPELFEEINKELLGMFYGDCSGSGAELGVKRWKGFQLRAIDGSILDLIDTADNREKFGVQTNQHGGTVQARMMIGYDVLNNLITHSYIGSLSIGEGNVVKNWISQMGKDELNIYDRLYPGVCLQYLHDHYGVSYVMRCKLGHNNEIKDFVASGKKEKTVCWKLNSDAVKQLKEMGIGLDGNTGIKVRMLRIELDDGEVEVLITNLLDNKKYPHKLFKELYFKRWGVEVEIGFLKNTLQIEIMSGKSIQAICQDFHASIFRANVQALIEMDCDRPLKVINKKRKLDYAVNRTARP